MNETSPRPTPPRKAKEGISKAASPKNKTPTRSTPQRQVKHNPKKSSGNKATKLKATDATNRHGRRKWTVLDDHELINYWSTNHAKSNMVSKASFAKAAAMHMRDYFKSNEIDATVYPTQVENKIKTWTTKYNNVKTICMTTGQGNRTEEELRHGSWRLTCEKKFPYFFLLDDFLGTRVNFDPPVMVQAGSLDADGSNALRVTQSKGNPSSETTQPPATYPSSDSTYPPPNQQSQRANTIAGIGSSGTTQEPSPYPSSAPTLNPSSTPDLNIPSQLDDSLLLTPRTYPSSATTCRPSQPPLGTSSAPSGADIHEANQSRGSNGRSIEQSPVHNNPLHTEDAFWNESSLARDSAEAVNNRIGPRIENTISKTRRRTGENSSSLAVLDIVTQDRRASRGSGSSRKIVADQVATESASAMDKMAENHGASLVLLDRQVSLKEAEIGLREKEVDIKKKMIDLDRQRFDLEARKEKTERDRLTIDKKLKVLEETNKMISIYLQNKMADAANREIANADKLRKEIEKLENSEGDGDNK